MSNQHQAQPPDLYTPIILQYKPAVETLLEDLNAVQAFVAETMNWQDSMKKDVIWTWYNQELATIPIETVRQILAELSYSSYMGKPRVIAVLAADRMTLPAQQAFLKSLEEPPTHTLIVLITVNPSGLLETIHSRCRAVRMTSRQNGTATSPTPELDDLITFVVGKTTFSFAQLTQLIEPLKEREVALAAIDQLIFTAHSHLSSQLSDTVRLTKTIILLLQTRAELAANANVLLALEHCFFEIKKLQ